jgi:hypothetical protein
LLAWSGRDGEGGLVKTFEARVVKGRLVVDEPSPYPDGTKVRLVAVDDRVAEAELIEELGKEGLAELKASLKRSRADFKARRSVSLERVARERRRAR